MCDSILCKMFRKIINEMGKFTWYIFNSFIEI